MTTLRQLQNVADRSFTQNMKDRGFIKVATGRYVRERWPFYDAVFWSILSSRETLRVFVTCWTPAGYSAEELENYPHCIGVIIGDTFCDTGFDKGTWTIGTPELESAVMESLFESLSLHAFPWFEQIQNPDQYLEKLRWTRDMSPDLRQSIKRELPLLWAQRGGAQPSVPADCPASPSGRQARG